MSSAIRSLWRTSRHVLPRLGKGYFRRFVSVRRCQRVLDWLTTLDLSLGNSGELTLPSRLAHASVRGRVHALRTEDGRYCALLKTSIGWKDNFEGVLCCNHPLDSSEIVEQSRTRTYISLADDHPFEELYVRTRRDDRRFDVYFDLN